MCIYIYIYTHIFRGFSRQMPRCLRRPANHGEESHGRFKLYDHCAFGRRPRINLGGAAATGRLQLGSGGKFQATPTSGQSPGNRRNQKSQTSKFKFLKNVGSQVGGPADSYFLNSHCFFLGHVRSFQWRFIQGGQKILLSISIPPGVSAGQTLGVKVPDGRELTVVVPPGEHRKENGGVTGTSW